MSAPGDCQEWDWNRKSVTTFSSVAAPKVVVTSRPNDLVLIANFSSQYIATRRFVCGTAKTYLHDLLSFEIKISAIQGALDE